MTAPKPPAAGYVRFSQEDIGLKFDWDTQTLEIFGVKYALGLFAFLGRDPIGTTMTILQRPGDGTVIIRDESEVNHRRRVMRDLLREIGEALSLVDLAQTLPPEFAKSYGGVFDADHCRQLQRRIEKATE